MMINALSMDEVRRKVAALTPYGCMGSLDEGVALLDAIVRMHKAGRQVTAQDLVDWKASRGWFHQWPRRDRENWLSWARRLVREMVVFKSTSTCLL